MPRYHWHVVAMPGQSDTRIGESVSWQDNMLPTIQAEADKKQFDGNFAVTFDEFITAAENIPNFFVELDGSFVWRSLEPPWQIDGVVFDRDEYVSQIELKGNSPRARCTSFKDGWLAGTTHVIRNDSTWRLCRCNNFFGNGVSPGFVS